MTPFWSHGEPISIVVQGDAPSGFRWEQRGHRVQEISTHWRVHTNWWRLDETGPPTPLPHEASAEVWRDYWEVTTDTGLLCVLYHDLIGDAWYLERIYE
jgi:hypothetical protein